jgi:hypothetical protein
MTALSGEIDRRIKSGQKTDVLGAMAAEKLTQELRDDQIEKEGTWASELPAQPFGRQPGTSLERSSSGGNVVTRSAKTRPPMRQFGVY